MSSDITTLEIINGAPGPYKSKPPKIGLVIGTFAAVPYIHLHLASWKRFFPHVPVLVCDDGSPFASDLDRICKRYGAYFHCRPQRGRWCVGDLASYVTGLDWARELKLDILAKMSRRFIPLHDWTALLADVASRSQMPTFSQVCDHFNFGFRTECVAFGCNAWVESGCRDRMNELVMRNESVFVEGYVHELARSLVRTGLSLAARQYINSEPRPSDRDGYAVWGIMPDRRVTKRPNILWHDSDAPFDYLRVATTLGIDEYSLDQYGDPNQGCGTGDP